MVAEHPYTVFLSHVHQDSALVTEVAQTLRWHGLGAFVAPHDIPGSSEWLQQVERALLRCDALAAFLRPEFRGSAWADQEVGYVLGRRRKVLPLRLVYSESPHGFLARFQSIDIQDLEPSEVASVIFDVLYGDPKEHSRLVGIVLHYLTVERDPSRINAWVSRAELIKNPTLKQLELIKSAAVSNTIISTNGRLLKRLESIGVSSGARV